MNIRTWWKQSKEASAKARKERFVAELLKKLEAINDETNEGRLRHLVYHMHPDIREMTTESGGWGNSSVDITMSDHFTIYASEFWLKDALRSIANKVYERLLDKHGISLPEELK